MLRKLKENEYQQYLDFAYQLALDPSRSCYPSYADGLKTRQYFDSIAARAFQREHNELLLFEDNGEALGLIQYYAIPEDDYVQAQLFSVKANVPQAMEELMAYLRERWAGCDFYVGVSEQNREAVETMERLGFRRHETSNVGVMRFKDYELLPEPYPLTRITRENFHRFAALHARWDGEMYWDNAHLLEDLDDWHIYLYERDGQALGAIYFRYVDQSMEIFGWDFPDNRLNPEVLRALMIRTLNQSKSDGMADLTVFHEDEERPVLESVGVRWIDLYLGYVIKL